MASLDRRHRRRWGVTEGPVFLDGRDLPRGIPLLPAPAVPAWEYQRTKEAWRQYLFRLAVIGAATAGISALAIGAHRWVATRDDVLLDHGVRTTGVILDGGYGGRNAQAWVHVRYHAEGQTRVGVLEGPSPDDLSRGTRVLVYYDAAKPARFRTTSYANHSDAVDNFVLTVPPIASLTLLLAAAVCLIRLFRWRWWFARLPWQTWRGTPETLVESRLGARCFELSSRGEDGTKNRALLRCSSGFKWGTSAKWIPDGQVVLYIPGPRRRGVILPADARVPIPVMLPASVRQHHAWHQRMGRGNPHAQFVKE